MSLDEKFASGKSMHAPGDATPDHAESVLATTITQLAAPAPGVSLWWCGLDVPAAAVHALESTLSDAERTRASRFGTAALRERYIVGRASLRSVLGAALGIPPGRVPIVRGERGRPRLGHDVLAPPAHRRSGHEAIAIAGTIDFNVSHTAGVALIGTTSGVRDGIASDLRIGVDIERRDRAINAAGIARKFLSAAERSALAALDADTVRLRVLKLWTCKEAMSKATGDALSAPFAALAVDLADGPRLIEGPAPYVPARWDLRSASAPEEFFATVALWRP